MKRDMDLVRKILLAVADSPHGSQLQQLDGVSNEDFTLHAIWLAEAGLVIAITSDQAVSATYALILRLTWQGCDFVDAIRDDTLWKKAKESVMKPATSFTFDLVKDWLKAEIAQGLPTLRGLA
ncbi:DUF2513 domain-containing protein [Xylophilus ampelinus]|uniref:Uncharacterized protein DUF2513 n=1 Tax=Xylophilus ampelinus TaxID=54067 RepID=A0A318SKR2_9BURK|nr:DUF2513 domain-containing protein [Xylophilus ampelinus]MCS4508908.1 DUF2513 domain-containing protein [Xylophilus ampelinus]PYE79475.1 uncharacterized protein DUF2513 [Xylophilus ampelinus]